MAQRYLRVVSCQQFNSDPTIDCLLLTTSVGGLGLNLTGADTVIFLEHDFNPQRDLQAMDRAHRIGQQASVVNVYRIICKSTLEERIMGLQRFKLHIANSVVNAENASMKSMDTSQVLERFESSIHPRQAATLPLSSAPTATADDAVRLAINAASGTSALGVMGGVSRVDDGITDADDADHADSLSAFLGSYQRR
jgi:TATA-binding protein-associated factor